MEKLKGTGCAEGPHYILGCPCLAFSSEAAVMEAISGLVSSRRGGYTVAINCEKIMRASRDPALIEVIKSSILPVPDGVAAVWGMRWAVRAQSIKVDLPKSILATASRERFSLFMCGATEEVNAMAAARATALYSGIRLVGRLNGFVEEEVLIAAIRDTEPQIVMLAVGSPRQEFLAARLEKRFPHVLFVGCGGAFDVLAGKAKRAPAFFVNNGLEWAYRLYKQPSRLRRQLVIPKFMWRLALQTIRSLLLHPQRPGR